MKKKLILPALMSLLLLGAGMTNGFAAASQNMMIGVVDVHNILKNSHHITEMKEQLKKEFSPREDAIRKEQSALINKIAKHNRNKNVMSSEKFAKDTKMIKNDKEHLQQKQMQFQQDFMKAQEQKMNNLLDSFKNKASQIAKKHHLDVVIAKSSTLYVSNKYDITDEVKAAFE